MLAYLHLAAVNGVVVSAYVDHSTGVLSEAEGGGRFTEIVLHPLVTVTDQTMVATADSLHERANADCFIANSLNLPVGHEARTRVA
jgi:organic hydroperoxide reductase OsmC/OhrA